LTSYRKTLGSGHPTTQACQKHYSALLKGTDDLDTEVLSTVHPDTLIRMANLASTYWNQGR
jgi:hypothetical protein